ncbi:beta-ketoacyl synthase N-terminal-like domain-containing protein [Catenulispora yoronensis]
MAVLGVGMHPWGAQGKSFIEYGLVAARAALADAGVGWRDVQLVVGGETIRNGYPGFVAGSALSQALGWQGAPVASCYAACATGAQALSTARAHILAGLADVVLVVGADTTPKGFSHPSAATVRTTRIGCDSVCWARRTRRISVCMRGGVWHCAARPRRTSRR